MLVWFAVLCEVNFAPQQPLVVDTFKNCEGLSRIAFLDGNGVVMLGKIVKKVDKVCIRSSPLNMDLLMNFNLSFG